ncbi:unnamed protein product [Taenia asiatica]|uniref:ANAPC4_WD40 domain-containing protein n=1 Tax=Taenia asiatica TaxID=60517 RepID=A0A0R3W1A8_TAEAS|nr:unnamed protein product [Taenia asiatica]
MRGCMHILSSDVPRWCRVLTILVSRCDAGGVHWSPDGRHIAVYDSYTYHTVAIFGADDTLLHIYNSYNMLLNTGPSAEQSIVSAGRPEAGFRNFHVIESHFLLSISGVKWLDLVRMAFMDDTCLLGESGTLSLPSRRLSLGDASVVHLMRCKFGPSAWGSLVTLLNHASPVLTVQWDSRVYLIKLVFCIE